jgi:hypothetical protein
LAYSDKYESVDDCVCTNNGELASLILSSEVVDFVCKCPSCKNVTLVDLYGISVLYDDELPIIDNVLYSMNVDNVFCTVALMNDGCTKAVYEDLEFQKNKFLAFQNVVKSCGKRYLFIKVPISWSPMQQRQNKLGNTLPFLKSSWNINTFNCLSAMSDLYQKHLFGKRVSLLYRHEQNSCAYFIIKCFEEN